MADVGIGINRVIQDVDGEAATVTNNKLDVNATLVAGATIDIGDVDLFLDGGTALVGGNGTATAGTLRVTIASDTTGVLSVDDNGSTLSIDDGGGSITIDGTVDLGSTATTHLSEIEGAVETIEGAVSGSEMQVDVVASLPTGSNNIGIVGLSAGSNTFGKLAANSGVDIGDVDVTSTVQSDPFGTFVSYPDFEAATTATAINDATNGVNASITDAKEIIIQTDDENTGYIMVGSSGNALAGSVGSRKGIKMNGGETLILAHSTFANIFIDASGSSQYVNVAYFK